MGNRLLFKRISECVFYTREKPLMSNFSIWSSGNFCYEYEDCKLPTDQYIDDDTVIKVVLEILKKGKFLRKRKLIFKSKKLADEIEIIISKYRDRIDKFPENLHNYRVLDGYTDYLKVERKTIWGGNILSYLPHKRSKYFDNLSPEEQKTETTTEYTDWSSKSTSKPTAKEGREIDTQTVKKSYKKKSCTPGENYTKIVKGRDSKALYCKPINDTSTNKGNGYYYTCTYKGEETCKTITKYKNITYYSYRDKVEKEITTTYYQTRTVSENTVYTDYILEKDIPSGYIKLSGSEITQYRYRQVCSK